VIRSDSIDEVPNGDQNQRLHETVVIATMTRWEKFEFWLFPVGWAFSAGLLFLISALLLLGYSVAALLHLQAIGHHPGALKNLGLTLAILVPVLAISGALLIYPVKVFRKMARRKKESGSPYPGGGELIARRNRWEHPPVWLRIVVILFFSLIAFGITYSLWVSPDRRVLAYWSWPALFWLVAIMVAVDAIWPRPGRLWTGSVASIAFGLLAVLAVVVIVRHGNYKASDSFFPLLFAFCSVFLAVATAHEGKKKMRPSSPSTSTPAATP
jgi:hypothetical protein